MLLLMFLPLGPHNGLSCLLQYYVKISKRWCHPVSVGVEANSHASLDSGRCPAWLGSAPWSGRPDTGWRQTQILAVIPHTRLSDTVFAWVSLNVINLIPLSVWWHFREKERFFYGVVWQSERNWIWLIFHSVVIHQFLKALGSVTDAWDKIQFLVMYVAVL